MAVGKLQQVASRMDQSTSAIHNPPQELTDPRETGNMFARLQVAEELTTILRHRLKNLISRLQGEETISGKDDPKAYLAFSSVPDALLENAHAALDALGHVEGILGV